MNRLLATMWWDIQLQFRNGFYYATAFIVVVWIVIRSQLPALDLGWLLPALVSGNLIINTFYFVGGLMLLEKGEGTLEALVVTPLRIGEYLASKVLTLTLLALVENIILVALLYGLGFSVLPLVVGLTLASALYVLAGFLVVARYDSINEYLLPSILYTSVLSVPLLVYLGMWTSWAIYLHPLHAPLLVMEAAFGPVDTARLLYGVLYSALWIVLVAAWSQRVFRRFIVAREGVR
ncbi:MAG: ABC transporter [Dehalococcoidia bacterium]|nr:ABC transporter [Dehalococcoidia bacterium]